MRTWKQQWLAGIGLRREPVPSPELEASKRAKGHGAAASYPWMDPLFLGSALQARLDSEQSATFSILHFHRGSFVFLAEHGLLGCESTIAR